DRSQTTLLRSVSTVLSGFGRTALWFLAGFDAALSGRWGNRKADVRLLSIQIDECEGLCIPGIRGTKPVFVLFEIRCFELPGIDRQPQNPRQSLIIRFTNDHFGASRTVTIHLEHTERKLYTIQLDQ